MSAIALVVGASGGIGRAVVEELLQREPNEQVVAVSRSFRPEELSDRVRWLQCDGSESAIESIVSQLQDEAEGFRRVVICSGMLHRGELQPEKSLEQLAAKDLSEVMATNLAVPALWVSRLVRPLRRNKDCVVAVLSARVGSIGDNRLGGWYSYRSSKAALNMFLKTAAIEYARRARGVKLVAFHPGTTDTALSSPFQKNVAQDKLFTPQFVAQRLLLVTDELAADGQLSFVDWAGESVPW